MSHLDDAQLDAYLAGRAEFADRAARREAGRHIADCTECSNRLRHAWSGHPESIDHPIGPAGRPSWPLFRAERPVAPPPIPSHRNAWDRPSDQRPRATVSRASAPTRSSGAGEPRSAAPTSDDDPLSGTPWPALIAALEAVLRPNVPEPKAPPVPLRRAPGDGWVVDEPPPEFDARYVPELRLVDHSGDVPALDLDLESRYQTRVEHTRRRARRRQLLAAAAMLLLAVLLAGAVLKVGAAALTTDDAWRTTTPSVAALREIPSATLFERAAALQAFAESVRAAGDSLDSTSAIVASVLHPDVRQAINDPAWDDTALATGSDTAGGTASGESDRAPAAAEPTRAPAATAEPAAPPPAATKPRLPAARRASSPDTALATGEWQETTAETAERLLGRRLLVISGLGLESVAKPGNSGGPFVRIAQVTGSRERVAIVLSRTESPPGSPRAPPGLGAIRILPGTEANPTAMAMGRWGDLLVTVRAQLPADTLRAFMGRLREVRD